MLKQRGEELRGGGGPGSPSLTGQEKNEREGPGSSGGQRGRA
jgi:hypothetical protein